MSDEEGALGEDFAGGNYEGGIGYVVEDEVAGSGGRCVRIVCSGGVGIGGDEPSVGG